MRQEPELDPVNIGACAVHGFDDPHDRAAKAHLIKRDREEIDHEDGKEERLEKSVKALFDKAPKRDQAVEEITRKEEEQWHVEGIDELMHEWRRRGKVVVSQHYQQDPDPSRNIHIVDSVWTCL